MGMLRQTRRAMTQLGHDVGHINGKVSTMRCRACGERVEVDKYHKIVDVLNECPKAPAARAEA